MATPFVSAWEVLKQGPPWDQQGPPGVPPWDQRETDIQERPRGIHPGEGNPQAPEHQPYSPQHPQHPFSGVDEQIAQIEEQIRQLQGMLNQLYLRRDGQGPSSPHGR